MIRAGGTVRWPYGAASRSLIHERDIAAVAARALTEPAHAGATYVLTGAESLTQAEQVRIIGEVIGRPVRWEELSPDEARRMLLAAWGDRAFVEIDGPFLGGDRFAVRFAFDRTFIPTGERTTTTKVSLYTLADGRIAREEVYDAQDPLVGDRSRAARPA